MRKVTYLVIILIDNVTVSWRQRIESEGQGKGGIVKLSLISQNTLLCFLLKVIWSGNIGEDISRGGQ